VERRAWHATQELPEWTGRFECCNLLVRRSALLESDGFDEEIFFGEDVAGGLAVMRRGCRAAFAPDALVHHDVTHPGFAWWLRRGLQYGNLARVARRYPELRRELFFGRVFLRPRSAKLVAALAGAALAGRSRWALAAALPYAWERRPRGVAPRDLTLGVAQPVLFDLAILAGMLSGSARHRSLVL
jgi:GT2 family glycosyltransferase